MLFLTPQSYKRRPSSNVSGPTIRLGQSSGGGGDSSAPSAGSQYGPGFERFLAQRTNNAGELGGRGGNTRGKIYEQAVADWGKLPENQKTQYHTQAVALAYQPEQSQGAMAAKGKEQTTPMNPVPAQPGNVTPLPASPVKPLSPAPAPSGGLVKLGQPNPAAKPITAQPAAAPFSTMQRPEPVNGTSVTPSAEPKPASERDNMAKSFSMKTEPREPDVMTAENSRDMAESFRNPLKKKRPDEMGEVATASY